MAEVVWGKIAQGDKGRERIQAQHQVAYSRTSAIESHGSWKRAGAAAAWMKYQQSL